MIHTDGRPTIAMRGTCPPQPPAPPPTEIDIKTEELRMRSEELSRALASEYGITLEEAQAAIMRALTVPLDALGRALRRDDTALD